MSDLVWASALSPEEPFVPRTQHWLAGTAATVVLVLAGSAWYASLDHSIDSPEEIEEERVVVALGGAAPKRIDAPPPAPKDAPITDTPAVVAERAEDADPIAPPPEPRPVAQWSQGDGTFSSGTGGTAQEPPPPPPPPPKPSPEPSEPVAVGGKFAKDSTARYSSLIEYPSASLRQGEEGLGVISVIVEQNGQVVRWWLEKSTGWPRLDKEIERVARKVRRLDPPPGGFRSQQARVNVPIRFKIETE